MKETMFIVGASEFVVGVNMEESHVVCSQTPSYFILDIGGRSCWKFRKQVDSSGGVGKHADSSGGAMFSCLLGAMQIELGLLCSKL